MNNVTTNRRNFLSLAGAGVIGSIAGTAVATVSQPVSVTASNSDKETAADKLSQAINLMQEAMRETHGSTCEIINNEGKAILFFMPPPPVVYDGPGVYEIRLGKTSPIIWLEKIDTGGFRATWKWQGRKQFSETIAAEDFTVIRKLTGEKTARFS